MKGYRYLRSICAIASAAAVVSMTPVGVMASELFADTTGMPSASDWSMVSSPTQIKPQASDFTPVSEKKELAEVPTISTPPVNTGKKAEKPAKIESNLPDTPEVSKETPEPVSGSTQQTFMTSYDGEKTPSTDDKTVNDTQKASAMPDVPTLTTVETPKAAEGAQKAEAEYQENQTAETPAASEIEKPKALSRKEAPSIMETTKWEVGENRSTKISVNVFAGQTRFEMFYSAAAPMPAITFTSIDGNIYRAGEDFNNGRTSFICRPGNKIDGNADINYCVMYISAPTDPGSWTAEITLDKGTKEFMLIKTAVPNGWTDFVEEYRMSPEEMCLWYTSKISDYSANELINLANVDTNPGANSISTTDAPKIEEKDYTLTMIIGGFGLLIFAMITGTILIIKKSNRDEAEYTKRRIDRANKKLKQKQKMADSNLESALKELDEDYSDDAYFSETSTFEEDDEEIEIPVQKNMQAYDELVINNDKSPKLEDVKNVEKTVVNLPEWLSGEEEEKVVDLPAWLKEDNMAATFF